MKYRIIFIPLLIMFVLQTNAQLRTKKTNTKSLRVDSTSLVSRPAFNHLVKRDISFIVLGEESPTSGFTYDSEKTETALSGQLPTQKGILLVNLGYSFNENTATLFSKNTFNKEFQASLDYHLIPRNSRYSYAAKTSPIIRNHFNQKYTADSLAVLEEIVVLRELFYIHSGKRAIELKDLNQSSEVVAAQLPDPLNIATAVWVKMAKEVNKKMKECKNCTYKSSAMVINEFVKHSAHSDSYAIMLALSKKLEELVAFEQKFIDYELEQVEHLWTFKRLHWITFSPFYKGQVLRFFEDDLFDARKDTLSAFGLNINYNYLATNGDVNLYVKGGLAFSRGNNVSEFDKVDYVNTKIINSNGQQTFSSQEKGTAFTNEDDSLRQGFVFGMNLEYYVLPNKATFIPGLAVTINPRVSKVYEDKWHIPVTIGVPFNVLNKDKEKNFLTIMPFMRWNDLTDTKSEEETSLDLRERNLSLGLKVGVPINLPGNKVKKEKK